MKARLVLSAMSLLMLIGACGTGRVAGPGVYYDDVYYVPGQSRENNYDAFDPVPTLTREEQKAESRALAAQQREYERNRGAYYEDTRDFSQIQNEYASVLKDGNIQNTDTLIYYNDETGYWVNGFNGSDFDRSYAERLIRFHGPAIRIPYYSPLYSEIVYFNSYDWNVYVDGHYAYAVPTWTNRWYDYYYFDRFHYGTYYTYGNYPYAFYGWGSPFSRWSFGLHRYYNGFYSRYDFYDPWYYYSKLYYKPNYSFRPGNYVSGPRRDSNSGIRLNGTEERGLRGETRTQGDIRSTTPRSLRNDEPRSLRSEADGSLRSGSTVTDAGARRASEEAASRGGQSTVKSGQTTGSESGQATPTRRSYTTPTYSQGDNTSRPVYNRASYTRVSNAPRPAQTTGTVQSGTEGSTRSVQQSSTTIGTPRTAASQPAVRSSSSTPGSTSSGVTTRPAVRQSAPVAGSRTATQPSATPKSGSTAVYQRGSSTSAPSRSSSGSSSSGSSYSAPSRSSSSGSSSGSSYSTPSRSSSSYSGSRSGGSSSGGSSSGGATRSGGRR